MMTTSNWSSSGDHFGMSMNGESLCCKPDTVIRLYVICTSVRKETMYQKKKRATA